MEPTHAMRAALSTAATIKEMVDRLKAAHDTAPEGDDDPVEQIVTEIIEYPLSVEYRSDWTPVMSKLKIAEVRVVICTGGPHVEIQADYDERSVANPRIIYKDWGTAGELLPDEFDRAAVVRFLEELLLI